MPDHDEQPDNDFDDLEHAKGVNFRDYPSSTLVVVAAALSSGLGWMLYKWVGRKRAARSGDPKNSEGPEGANRPAASPDSRKVD